MSQSSRCSRRKTGRITRMIAWGVLMLLVGCKSQRESDEALRQTAHADVNTSPYVHRLILHHADNGLPEGEINGQPAEIRYGGIVLPCPAPRGEADQGTPSMFTSPVVDAPIAFNEALLSWNVDTPPNVSFAVEMRVSDADTAWSRWLHIGEWGPAPPADERIVECAEGRIDVDYFFTSQQRFKRLQYRVRAAHNGRLVDCSSVPDAAARIAQVAICLSDTTDKRPPAAVPAKTERSSLPAGPVEIPVPYRRQGDNRRDIAGRTCSPTSLSMVLEYRGVDRPTDEVAARALDRVHDIYGNWPQSIQAAYSYGVPGYLDRFATLDEVRWLVDRDQPVIASITSKKGMLDGAPYKATKGHLLVIIGFDRDGNVIVNDPAAKDAESGRRTYRREQVEQVWLRRKGGTAYILLPPPEPEQTTLPLPRPDEPVVDVCPVDPRIVVDVRYATEDNFTGQKLYPVARCMLRESVALRLRRVQDRLQRQALGLKVYDGYRPRSVQAKLWEIMPDPNYVAPPEKGSRHNRGGAVDVTLVDAAGHELEMPTKFDSFEPAAHADYAGGTETSRKNRKLLIDTMRAEGFRVLSTEWWHFDAPGWENYPILDVPLVEAPTAAS